MTVYYMRAADHILQAWSLAELAELVECAIEARDPIAWIRASAGRLLTDHEFATLLTYLSTPSAARGT